MDKSYLQWLVQETPTTWWHDSADLEELKRALAQGATGVTTNPLLTNLALRAQPQRWSDVAKALPATISAEARAEELMRQVVTEVAALLLPQYEQTAHRLGYVCGQVNPNRAGDRDTMLAMARRYHRWSPNIAVKLPVTAAGLDVLEECAAEGITVTATVSFCVPQVLAIAERYERGVARCKAAGQTPGRCFAVIMIGRVDDYLREVALDRRAPVTEADIRLAGLAVTKRAYQLYRERGYGAVLLVAALRGTYHMTELAGGEIVMSIAPKVQAMLLQGDLPREPHIAAPVDERAIARLRSIPEFVQGYDPDGLAPADFLTWGLTQRTLTQFAESGWNGIEAFR
jgi:transaldolase